MKNLLSQLDSQVFIMDIFGSFSDKYEKLELEINSIEGFSCQQIDETSLEIGLKSGLDINTIFSALDKAGLKVTGMRNKSNRLEQLFLSKLNDNE